MTTLPFERTLAAARAGEAWACARIYEDLKRPVVAYVRLRGAADPDDVTSEVFLSVFRDLHRFSGDEHDFRAWVFTIAHRRVLDAWRRRSRRPVTEPLPAGWEPSGGDAEEDALSALGNREVEAVLARLTPEQRDVVLLHVVADLPLAEVAAVMGRSVGAVKSLQYRALGALRRSLPDPAVSSVSPAAIPWMR